MLPTLPPIFTAGASGVPPNIISGFGPWGPTHMLAVVPAVPQHAIPADAYVVFHDPNVSPRVGEIQDEAGEIIQVADEHLLKRSGDYYLSSRAPHDGAMEIHIALRSTDRIVAQAQAFEAALRTMFNVSASHGFLRVVLPDVGEDGFGALPLRPFARLLAISAMECWGKRPEAAPNQVVLAHERSVPSSVGVFRNVFDEHLGRTIIDDEDESYGPPICVERFCHWMWRAISPTGRRAKEMESMLRGKTSEPVTLAMVGEMVQTHPDVFDRGVVNALSALAMSGVGRASHDALDILKALHIENRDVGPYAGWLLARVGLQTNLAIARGRWGSPE